MGNGTFNSRRLMTKAILGALACTLTLLLALTPTAQAALPYEQVANFAGSATPLTPEQIEADEEIQLGGVNAMAVNRTGAGGVPKGTVYAVAGYQDALRVVRYDPVAEPKAGEPWLKFAEAWQVKAIEGLYERCGPLVIEEGKGGACKVHPGGRSGEAHQETSVAVDQTTGYVYVYNGATGSERMVVAVYTSNGSAVVTRFAELVSGGSTTASTPGKFHSAPPAGGIAVNEAGEVYLVDVNGSDNFYHRLMVFKPEKPGDYSKYEYAGEIAAGFLFENNYPNWPTFDDAGNLYVGDEEHIERLPAQEPEPYPAAHPAPTCSFKFAKGGITAMTVNPLSGEPFFFSYKKEKEFTHKVMHQLGPCEGGTFKETAKYEVTPERDDLSALVFDPERKLEASRPAGVLYGGAPAAVPRTTGTGEPGQSALGYVFALPKGSTKALSVAKTGAGAGTVTSSPAGISCGSKCSAEFAEGEKVTLSAKADLGSSFAGWSGACAGSGACEVTMSEAKAVTAAFSGGGGPVLHTLKVTVTGEGKVSADSGTISGCTSAGGSNCEGSYEEGTKVTLTETPKAGSLFAGWGTPQCDESKEATCQITIGKGDEGVAASFEAEPEEPGIPLSVSVEGPGTVTSDKGLISCAPFCSDEYPEGTKVTLSASPTAGSLFMAWKHCDTGAVNGRQCTVSMSKAKEVQAVFLIAHALTLTKAGGSGPGKLTASGGIVCLYACEHASALFKEGAAVSVTEAPAKHFHFAGWGGDCTGKGACQLSMGEDHEVSADFEEDPKLLLSLSKTGGGQALIKSKPAGLLCGYTCFDAESSFYEGEAVTVSWKLNKGTTKLTWSEGAGTCTGTSEALEGSCTLTMSAATALAATLE